MPFILPEHEYDSFSIDTLEYLGKINSKDKSNNSEGIENYKAWKGKSTLQYEAANEMMQTNSSFKLTSRDIYNSSLTKGRMKLR